MDTREANAVMELVAWLDPAPAPGTFGSSVVAVDDATATAALRLLIERAADALQRWAGLPGPLIWGRPEAIPDLAASAVAQRLTERSEAQRAGDDANEAAWSVAEAAARKAGLEFACACGDDAPHRPEPGVCRVVLRPLLEVPDGDVDQRLTLRDLESAYDEVAALERAFAGPPAGRVYTHEPVVEQVTALLDRLYLDEDSTWQCQHCGAHNGGAYRLTCQYCPGEHPWREIIVALWRWVGRGLDDHDELQPPTDWPTAKGFLTGLPRQVPPHYSPAGPGSTRDDGLR